MKTLRIVFLVFICLLPAGCGNRIIGNPSNYTYEEFSNYHDYTQEQTRKKEQELKTQKMQSTLPNPPLISESACDFNKQHGTQGRCNSYSR